jgi:6-phosphogluconate dehydrogenase (decarboxylating)
MQLRMIRLGRTGANGVRCLMKAGRPRSSDASWTSCWSHGDAQFADRLLSAIRKAFGGHSELVVHS